ncbi:MAG TPA: ABC transporter permease, partial [Cyclobacteriaceae bacterium]|nr:ABC transporter permease [Cyclobacteriaceae bacterium]
MIRNYLLVALRNLSRQLSYSLINISGLAIGIACSLVMFLYVYTEWSYDRHFSNADRIYKIGVSFFNMGNFAVGPEVLGDVLPAEFEGVEAFTRIKQSTAVPIQVDDTTFPETVFYTDSSFFKVFSYEFIQGNAPTALAHPASMVLTESMANKYFHENNAIGKTILAGKEKRP